MSRRISFDGDARRILVASLVAPARSADLVIAAAPVGTSISSPGGDIGGMDS